MRGNYFVWILFFMILFFHCGCVLDQYSPEGEDYGDGFYFEWYTFIGDSANNQVATGLAHDREGNIYIIGTSDASLEERYGTPLNPFSETEQSLLIKVNPDGNILWHTFLPGNDYKLFVDKIGNSFLFGNSDVSFELNVLNPIAPYSGGRDLVLIKMNSDGNVLWYTFMGGPEDDSSISIKQDQQSGIYIYGFSYSFWNDRFGSPLNRPIDESWTNVPFLAKMNQFGDLISYTFPTCENCPTFYSGSFCISDRGKINAIVVSGGTGYSTDHHWELDDDLHQNFFGKKIDESRLHGSIFSLKNGNYYSYYPHGRQRYWYDKEKYKFVKYDSEYGYIWAYVINNEGDGPSGYASFGIHDLKIDQNEDIYFVGANSGRLLKDYYDFPIISPLLTYIHERVDDTILSRKFLMKIGSSGNPEWYSYFGDSERFSWPSYRMTVLDTGEFYISEKNSNSLWPDMYGTPLQKFTGLDPGDDGYKSSIVLAKFRNNPRNLRIRIYESTYEKLVFFKKKTYVKLKYSIILNQEFTGDRLTYILYKFDNDEKKWVELDRHKETGAYTYKDKHVYDKEFNHYKVTTFAADGERIAESRIVSLYPPAPNLNQTDSGD